MTFNKNNHYVIFLERNIKIYHYLTKNLISRIVKHPLLYECNDTIFSLNRQNSETIKVLDKYNIVLNLISKIYLKFNRIVSIESVKFEVFKDLMLCQICCSTLRTPQLNQKIVKKQKKSHS